MMLNGQAVRNLDRPFPGGISTRFFQLPPRNMTGVKASALIIVLSHSIFGFDNAAVKYSLEWKEQPTH
jgi:hypothetical protein